MLNPQNLRDFLPAKLPCSYSSYNVKMLVITQLTFTRSKLTIKALEKRVKYVFIVNFEHISHLFLAFLWLTLNKNMLAIIFFS